MLSTMAAYNGSMKAFFEFCRAHDWDMAWLVAVDAGLPYCIQLFISLRCLLPPFITGWLCVLCL